MSDQILNSEQLKIWQRVYHKDIYDGKERMEIVGIRKTEVELQGDYSGGTNNVVQKSWMPIVGLIISEKGK